MLAAPLSTQRKPKKCTHNLVTNAAISSNSGQNIKIPLNSQCIRDTFWTLFTFSNKHFKDMIKTWSYLY